MARPVQIRPSYRDDAAHLLRLEAAIEKDVRQSQEWRDDMKKKIRSLAQDLLAVESQSS